MNPEAGPPDTDYPADPEDQVSESAAWSLPSTRAGGQDDGSLNKLPQITSFVWTYYLVAHDCVKTSSGWLPRPLSSDISLHTCRIHFEDIQCHGLCESGGLITLRAYPEEAVCSAAQGGFISALFLVTPLPTTLLVLS